MRKIDDIERWIWQNRGDYYRLAYSYVRDKEDALDIVSDSITKALRNKKGLRDRKAVKTWFYRIVVNTSLDFIRKNGRIIYVEDMSTQNDGQEDQYENIDLQHAMTHLPEKYRVVLILRYFEDMKSKI